MRYRPRYILEYILVRLMAALLNALPYRLALAAVWPLAFFAFHVVRFRRAEAMRRIREVFGPDLPARQIRHIAWISMRNTAFNIVEMMRAPEIGLDWIDRHIPGFSQEIPIVKTLVEKHGGAVITVPHMGNWDLAGWACDRHGIKMFSVAAKQKNPLVNDWINQQRESGMTVLERGSGTLKSIIKLLRTGNVLAILPDVRVYTPDLEIPFLGGIANFGRGMAMFAITAKVPIFPAIFWREGWTQHCFKHMPPIFPNPALDKAQDARRITEEVIALVDEAIRQAPEQWFWYNKRWVLTPVRKPQKTAAATAADKKGSSST